MLISKNFKSQLMQMDQLFHMMHAHQPPLDFEKFICFKTIKIPHWKPTSILEGPSNPLFQMTLLSHILTDC